MEGFQMTQKAHGVHSPLVEPEKGDAFGRESVRAPAEGPGRPTPSSIRLAAVGRLPWKTYSHQHTQSPKAVCGRENFLQRLREERSRCDRNGHCFSLLLISLEQAMGSGVELGFLVQALRNFSRTTRLSDVLGWYGEAELGLLLPDTTEQEAQKVLERLRGFLAGMERCALGALAEQGQAFRILEYPKTLTENLLGNDSGQVTAADGCQCQGGLGNSGAQDCSADWGFLECTSPCAGRVKSSFWGRMDSLARRCLDLLGGSLALVFLGPVMLVIAAGIKLTSPGPVLFRQTRMGQNGKSFTFLKFRTMYHNCDQSLHREYVTRLIENRAETHDLKGKTFFKLARDPRVTPLGRILRITSLDELPQLFNVLKGEMSLVGPRPPIPYEVEHYKSWQLRRLLEARPGITGLWQVCGRATTTFEEQVRLDLRYVEKQCLWLDLWILLKTFKAVFTTRGAC
ncbi:MAG: sugar transferase [bacterium]